MFEVRGLRSICFPYLQQGRSGINVVCLEDTPTTVDGRSRWVQTRCGKEKHDVLVAGYNLFPTIALAAV